ncbi:hypothetical protein ACFQMM_22730 [Saliphagus sp. GCM10025308]
MASQEEKDILEKHISKGETAIDVHTRTVGPNQVSMETYLVTDGRLVTLDSRGKSGTVDSTFFDSLGGLTIDHKPSKGPDQQAIVVGILLVILGMISFGALGVADGSSEAILVIAGLAAAVVGVLMLLDAYKTEDGTVTVSLQTREGQTATSFTLKDDYLEFAWSVSKAVSDRHQ